MMPAKYQDKNWVIEILTDSFKHNMSVNYIIKQDKNKVRRIKNLMNYSFEICYLFGDVFFSDDKNACALILYPDKKKTTLKSVLLDAKLILTCVGLSNIKKTLRREVMIKKLQPKELMYYLWFIGVNPECQHKGIGSRLLKDIIKDSEQKRRSIFLETSTLKNIPWYKKFGFHIYNELELTYKLFFLKRGYE